jgi:hypothetical protein
MAHRRRAVEIASLADGMGACYFSSGSNYQRVCYCFGGLLQSLPAASKAIDLYIQAKTKALTSLEGDGQAMSLIFVFARRGEY